MAVAEVPFDLVETKLGVPSIRPGTVAKQDVIARLRASRLPFVTVIAPAGYGKTTLLAGWAEADPRPFAWVALDGRDDGVLFLRYIAAPARLVTSARRSRLRLPTAWPWTDHITAALETIGRIQPAPG